jgi:pimeloyl-ACP methyl ester carboxylesterase
VKQRSVTAAALSLAFLLSGCHGPRRTHPDPVSLSWRGCGDGLACSTLRVPVVAAQPDGPSVDLAVAELPATRQPPRAGTLLLLPGGPGDSGIDMLRASVGSLPVELRRDLDVVTLDPRGIGRSDALHCLAPQVVGSTSAAPATAGGGAPSACAGTGTSLALHMSSLDQARDVERLRQTLGVPRLSLLAVSYATFTALVYAESYPTRVQRIVLDGLVDPALWAGAATAGVPATGRLGSAEASERSLEAFAAACEATPRRCPLATAPGPATRLAALLKQASRGTLVGPDGRRVDRTDLVSMLVAGLQTPELWEPLSGELAHLRVTRTPPSTTPPTAGGAQTPMTSAYLAVTCADATNPPARGDWASAAAAADRRHSTFGRFWIEQSLPCSGNPPSPPRHAGDFSHVPYENVMVLTNENDPITSSADAARWAVRHPSTTLVTLVGWGHTAFLPSACVRTAAALFLTGSPKSSRTMTCHDQAAPFG